MDMSRVILPETALRSSRLAVGAAAFYDLASAHAEREAP